LVGATFQDGARFGSGFVVPKIRAMASAGKLAKRPHMGRIVAGASGAGKRLVLWHTVSVAARASISEGEELLIGDLRCPRCDRTDATRLSAQTALRVDLKCRFCALKFSISSSDMPAVVQGDPCRLWPPDAHGRIYLRPDGP
jgi:hypothetical protein